MSTRANILVKDNYDELWFYRHSDGYPSCTAESLKTFVGWVNEGKIRNNANQASGWLVLTGHKEYLETDAEPLAPTSSGYSGWKCGAYEPTSGQHGDIEYLYTIHLEEKTVKVLRLYGDEETTYSFDEFLSKDFQKGDCDVA